MTLNRFCILCISASLLGLSLVGCGSKDTAAVDAPLMTNAPPPPPRPNKLSPSVSGAGGGPATTPAPGGQSSPP